MATTTTRKPAAKKPPAPKKAAPANKPRSTRSASESPLVVGKAAPAFALVNEKGERRTLADYAGEWLVLYFYPRDDTPGCTTEACEFTAKTGELGALDAKVVGVSPDTPERHARFIAKYRLAVELLADPDKETLSAYGAYGKKMFYGKEIVGVIRSTVIIDPKGRIAHHFKNVKAAGHADAVAETLRQLRSAA